MNVKRGKDQRNVVLFFDNNGADSCCLLDSSQGESEAKTRQNNGQLIFNK